MSVCASLGVTMGTLIKHGIMLSCASDISIVNIDSGFSAVTAVTATLINKNTEASL
jgi:NCAIR mutase (PurE)-related protein